MHKQVNFFAITLSLFLALQGFSTNSSWPPAAELPPCPYQTPSNFQGLFVGSTFVTLGWTQAGPPPPFYNLKTFEVVSGTLVSNTTFPYTSPSHVVSGLTPNTSYRFELCALDGNFNCCVPPATAFVKSIIIDLLVVKFVPNYSCPVCTLQSATSNPPQGNNYCPFSSNGSYSYFRIQLDGNPSNSRSFQIKRNPTDGIYKLELDDEDSGYIFSCTQAAPPCSAANIEVRKNNILIANIWILAAASGQSQLYCTTLNAAYEIVKVENCPPLDSNGEINARKETDAVSAFGHLRVSPNPFNTTLELQIPVFTEGHDIITNVFDLRGQLVKSQTTTSDVNVQHLETAGLQPGLYLLQVKCGNWSETIKVVKTE